MYSFIYRLAKSVMTLFGGKLTVMNRERLPKDGSYVIVCNHSTWLDVLFLAFSVWPRNVHYMAKQELFQLMILKHLLPKIHAFPVNRENPGPSVLKTPLKLLRSGHVVGIFPTGTRTEEDLALKRGAVTIAYKASVPLIPAKYDGPKTFKELLSRKPIKVYIGKELDFTNLPLSGKELIENKSLELSQIFQSLGSKDNRERVS
ncbi:1-acyl-sn-glycerol-3-phosphate acyltransferase [Bacillus pakistanensis]|uniref:1-acyl-sn-glycerol-3-phosphate acyltransferase n=1 Tax=Rossellomorea pakistanensis TaxID=992288 RepID=A0ABS2NGL7_9BACI|nr:1-acyl-sn-glycerol-3-phosphate acyltransferase [Bacillus pakistanensis]MBM7587010.1 1-acyl-sn-glycerol-3-phosphate acyltransferase [Bacillus pakistanensis]